MEKHGQNERDFVRSAVKGLLSSELDAIQRLHEKLDDQEWPEFFDALDLMLSCTGRVIITGMGKSGHVGCKVTATLASLGVPCHFVHPAEASHGDLGMIVPGDVVLAFSNSGNTNELGAILNYAPQIDVPVVGITMGEDSRLTRAAKVVLLTPKLDEGCLLGLAPTTSTIAQMAIGDALAIGAASMKRFTRESFNQLHPGGSLGVSTCQVSEVMETGANMPLISESTPTTLILWTMSGKRSDVAGVVDPDGNLVGLVHHRDIRPEHTVSARDAMRGVEPLLVPCDTYATARDEMLKRSVNVCFVVDQNKPVGIVRNT